MLTEETGSQQKTAEPKLEAISDFLVNLDDTPLKARVEALAEASIQYAGVFAPLMNEAEFNEFSEYVEHAFKGALIACNEKVVELLQRSLGENK